MYKLEDFKPITGYEEFYIVNKFGRVISLDRKINNKGLIINLKRKDPHLKINGKQLYVMLEDKNFKAKRVNITKIVRNLFGRQKPIVLKREEKVKLVVEFERKPLNASGARGYNVKQIDDGKCIKVFATLAAAAKAVGGESRHISDCCYGKRYSYLGYKWEFYNLKQ